jgi:KaiC/GvpD/RAD55 family RecA-like ATPase
VEGWVEKGVVKLKWPKLGELLSAADSRKEVWAWDGVIPAKDLTLVAGYMKKGKTTLLTGWVNGLLKRGMYCGRGCGDGKKVLYLAPEEGDTLLRRFKRLGI